MNLHAKSLQYVVLISLKRAIGLGWKMQNWSTFNDKPVVAPTLSLFMCCKQFFRISNIGGVNPNP